MNELIPIRSDAIDGETRKTVNAENLHAFLQVSTKFADWIVRRIEQFGFSEGVDFVVNLNSEKNSGRPSKDYHLTLDMAKELSMVERTAKGKEARQYFLECERIAKDPISNPALPDFTNPAEAARAWASEYEGKARALAQLEEAQPAIEFHERVGDADSLHSIDETAKVLRAKPMTFRRYLKDTLQLFRLDGLPKQPFLDRGYVRTVETILPHTGKPYPQTFFTGKGLQWIQRRVDHSLMGIEI